MEEKQKVASREKIMLAAQEVFISKGKDGARMQEIADRAGVNKAMLFYYYTNKDLLYKEILRNNISQIFSMGKQIIISEIDPRKKLEHLVNAYINFLLNNQDLPKLILREVANGGENIKQVIREIKQQLALDIPSIFISMINESIEKKQFRKVDPKQTVMNIIGMCLIYFIGKPLIEVVLELEHIDEKKFLEERKKSIIELLEHGILARSKDVRSKKSL